MMFGMMDPLWHISRVHTGDFWFTLGGHQFYWNMLPFGLSSEPRVFTKGTMVVEALQEFPYLNDWFLFGPIKGIP